MPPNQLNIGMRYLIYLLLCSHLSIAQQWEIGSGLGFMNYKGDLSPSYRPFDARPAGGIFLRNNIGRAVSYRFGAELGRITANEARSQDRFLRLRGYTFKSTLAQANARVEYNFHNFRVNSAMYTSDWSPYAYLGFGGMYKLQHSNNIPLDVIANHAIVPATVNKFAVQLPYGVGFKKRWKGQWNYGGEFGSYKLLSIEVKPRNMIRYDYLDGLGPLADTNLLPEKTKNSNRDLGDYHFYGNFYISYVFYKVACEK
jgi:hypothetical protein